MKCVLPEQLAIPRTHSSNGIGVNISTPTLPILALMVSDNDRQQTVIWNESFLESPLILDVCGASLMIIQQRNFFVVVVLTPDIVYAWLPSRTSVQNDQISSNFPFLTTGKARANKFF
jgi:hypothetical protein